MLASRIHSLVSLKPLGGCLNHSRLIEHYHYALNTMQFDEMHDLMTADFHFKDPTTEILGRDNYIHYVENVLGIYKQETIRLEVVSDDEYVHEFYLTFLSGDGVFYDNLPIKSKIRIKNGLLFSYHIEYDLGDANSVDKNILQSSEKQHGGAVA